MSSQWSVNGVPESARAHAKLGTKGPIEVRDVAEAAVEGDFGTTLRSWDPTIHTWRISWTNPVIGHRADLIGGRSGSDIVQTGTRADGTKTRWTFTEITADSFHWLGEALQPDGTTWKLEGEFRAKRRTR